MNFSSLSPSCWQHFSPDRCNMGYPSMRCSPSVTACSRVSRLQGPARKPDPMWALLFTGPARKLSRSLSLVQRGPPTVSQPHLRHSYAPALAPLVAPPTGGSLHPHGPPGAAGESWLRMDHILSLLPYWPCCLQGCSTQVFSACFSLATITTQFFLIKYGITKVLSQFLIGPALARGTSILECQGFIAVEMEEAFVSFWQRPPL